jgi:DEAD/DEAH box helicase domain-containing protein
LGYGLSEKGKDFTNQLKHPLIALQKSGNVRKLDNFMDFTQLFEAAAQATAGGNQSLFASAIAAIPHIAFQQTLPGSPAQYSDIPDPLGTVKQALQATGIDRLYQHQAESYAALSKGKNVLLETPTASGKTLASVLYIMQQCQEGRTGLIVLPLRALAYDIFAKIQEINENLPTPLRISLHIGDISKADRDQDFKAGHPNLIIASPDVLHHLLYHKGRNGKRGVQAFFAKLGVIWLDEIHAYTSTFGANLAALCRRISLAVEQLNSSNPRLQWICTTATIGNSLEHCSLLTGQNASTFHSIAQSTARVQERELVMIDPRYDVNKKAAAIAKILLDCDHKGLVFANSRNGVKSIYRYLSEKTSLAEPFYGSLSQEKRVELIEAFSQNRKRCLVSTSSLEAGVDLDSVEFVVLAGLTSLNSLWQRIGRAGRHLPGLIALVPDANNVVDYYYSRNPEKLFGKAEAIKISLDYPPVLSRQLRCVAAEGGIFSLQVRSYFGNIAPHLCRSLLRQNILNCSADNRLWAGGYPH